VVEGVDWLCCHGNILLQYHSDEDLSEEDTDDSERRVVGGDRKESELRQRALESLKKHKSKDRH